MLISSIEFHQNDIIVINSIIPFDNYYKENFSSFRLLEDLGDDIMYIFHYKENVYFFIPYITDSDGLDEDTRIFYKDAIRIKTLIRWNRDETYGVRILRSYYRASDYFTQEEYKNLTQKYNSDVSKSSIHQRVIEYNKSPQPVETIEESLKQEIQESLQQRVVDLTKEIENLE